MSDNRVSIAKQGAAMKIAFGIGASYLSAVGSAMSAPPTFSTIDISGVANVSHSDCCCPGFTNGSLYPLGQQTYQGVPFQHGTVEDYAFTGIAIYCRNEGVQRTFSVPVSCSGASTIHLLLSAWNGCPINQFPEARFLVTAEFSDGSSAEWSLLVGVDFRGDHDLGNCDTTGANTVEVWNSGQGQHLDLVSLDIGQPSKLVSSVKVRNQFPGDLAIGPFVFGLTMETPNPCPADFNNDGQVNGGDLSIILGFWGTPAKTLPAADLNDDGTVNAQDLSILLGSWGPCPN